MHARRSIARFAAGCLLSVSISFAQTTVEYRDDFQSYKAQSNVPGWVDVAIGASKPDANGLYKTWPDPLNKDNLVYGTRQSSGKPEGKNPRIGTFSTLADRAFGGKGRFEYRGRFLRTNEESRIGLSFFSSYPEADRYYLIGLWSQDSGPLTMRLFASGGGAPSGSIDSHFTPPAGQWIRFLIQADDVDGETRIRARFWPDGSSEPAGFSIAAVDVSPSRLTGGRIGIWSAVKGEAYVDDLEAKSPIDTTPPAIRFTGATDGAVIATPVIRVSGEADDAVSVTVNGSAASIDPSTRAFLSPEIRLIEGMNAIAAIGADEVGNRATILLHLILDTRPPEISIASPPADACLDATAVAMSGTVADPHLQSVRVREGTAYVDATLDARASSWTASVPVTEGPRTLIAEGLDSLGHRSVVPRSVLVDRTPPAIEITTASGPAADGSISNRPIAFFVAVRDADPNAVLTLRLDANPFVSGATVSAEGAHSLTAVAMDCAGHRTERSIAFTIDTTAPRFASFIPADGTRVGAVPSAITGTVDPDAVSVAVVGTNVATAPANGSFSLTGLTFVEGENRFLLRATDRAGNLTEAGYRITIVTEPPSIEILERGTPIAEGALFNREVRPEIRTSDPRARLSATLDGAPFAFGTAISAEGPHTLSVSATGELGQNASRQVAFAIDRTPPAVVITRPQSGRLAAETVVVEGAAPDSVSVTVNGVPAPLAAGTFSATLPLEEGDNVLVAIAVDAAGNSGRAEVIVERDSQPTGVLITSPADGFLTNRAAIRVTGRVLDAGRVAGVTIGGNAVPIDSSGTFELAAVPLAEGENTIVAIATSKNGGTTSASARVLADRTPPALRILESGQPLSDQARFATSASLAIEVSDARDVRRVETRLDGAIVALPQIVTAQGGHAISAIAVDSAGNETRAERTFFVGGASAAGCSLGSLVPPSGSIVALPSTGLTGRTGGAAGVKVNGVPASVANGSFCATVELPTEGANLIEIACVDAAGNAIGKPSTITLVRSTSLPSVTIDAPEEGAATGGATVRVSGTAGAGVVDVTVNGAAAILAPGDPSTPRAYSLEGVRLSPGLNVLLVRAKTAAGRAATATRRVIHLAQAPALTITSPLPGQVVGSASAHVTGLWSGIDPVTLSLAGTAASAEIVYSGDRSGSFLLRDIPLIPGENALVISARDVRGRPASATVAVRRDDSAPAVQITAPLDNAIFGATTTAFTVTGTATAANGAMIEIGGHPATIVSSEAISETRTRVTFSGSLGFADLGVTPIVARVTEPSGRSAHHAIRVTKLESAPAVEQAFPAASASGVDPGAMVVVVFSNPMDRASLRCGVGEACAFRLESPSGSAVSGLFDVDRDALTFAPATPLEEGVEYTIRIGTTAKDAGGVTLASEYVSRFRVGLAAAPSAAPLLDALPARHCGAALAIAGSAPAGARIQLDVGSSKLLTTADASGRFRYDAPLTGEAGYLLVRARTIGSDGSLSAAAHACVLIDCGGLGVSAASFDRTVNTLTISFTAPVDAATATTGEGGAIRFRLGDSRIVGGAASPSNATTLSITPAENLRETSFTLEVTTAIRGTDGTPLSAPFTQPFLHDSGEPAPGDGTGFISGEIYDGSTGRPLGGARITIANATAILSDARGRYTLRLQEGAHAIHVTADGFTSAWRQVILPPGAGVTPIDIRLAKRAATTTVAALPLALADGGDDAVTTRAGLQIPSGSIGSGARVTFTSVGAQSLAGLLPLGWSPLGSAEIVVTGGTLAAATLSFDVPAPEVAAAAKPLSLVRYLRDRDEWRVLIPAVNVANGRASAPIAGDGDYALVYADGTTPSLAAGAALPAASDPCATTQCHPLTSTSFVLEPEMVLPDGIATATLVVDGSVPFPSGTAVQAWIDEELRLADGTSLLEPPFAADLVLYRALDGKTARASFHVAPSPRAAQVILESGYDHVRVRPYPGRLARGTLIGPEGGRVPSDGDVAIEIAAGASPEPIRASASSLPLEEIAALGAVAGFRVLGGVAFELERASAPPAGDEGDAPAGVVLLAPARLTIRAVESLPAAAQVVVAEVLGETAFGRVVRLVARAVPVPFEGGATLLTTAPIDRSVLPLDGIVREGRYLVLSAEAPIAFATGAVRRGATGGYVDGALVTAPPLGVADLTRRSGEFVIPVPAAPAPPFRVVPRHVSIGEGPPRAAASAPERDAIVVLGDVLLESQPPEVASTVPQNGATGVSLTTSVRVQFDRAIDLSSIAADSIAVTGPAGAVAGSVAADGAGAMVWTLAPGTSLRAGAVHTARVAAAVRSAAGAPLGRALTFSFETVAEIRSDDVRADRISITIPTAAGVSTIRGRAGALPSGWQALAVRRRRDFVTRYQATAAADGSFSFVAGTADPISVDDLIDLHVVNVAGSVAAILPLTPFVTADEKGFIARPYERTGFTSVDGIGVRVPADAFDGPVMVTVEPAQKAVLAAVPNLDAELRWSGSVEMRIDCLAPPSPNAPCVARERIDIELPVLAGTDPAGRIFLLGALGHSVRGPRLMVVDTLRIDGGRFTTARATTDAASVMSADSRFATSVLVDADAKEYLAGVNRAGVYSVVDVSVPAGSSFGWSLMDVTGGAYDLFNSTFASLYASSTYLAESRGRIAIPILTNKEFTISGYDAATGLKAFEKVYEPNPVGDPGAVFLLNPPVADASGPFPVFGTPFRIEALQVDVEGVDLEAIPNFTIRLEGGFVTAADTPGNALPADVPVALMNPATGSLDATRGDGLQVPGKRGDRVVLLVRETRVEPAVGISLVFNESLSLGSAVTAEEIDAFLKTKIRVEHRLLTDPSASPFTDATPHAKYRTDSGGRRIRIEMPGQLHPGSLYRVRVANELADPSGLKILQFVEGAQTKGGLASDLILEFATRAPGGAVGEFDIRQDAATQLGAIRDLAREGNLMFVSAMEGGLLAYDVSSPAAAATTPLPLSYVSGAIDDYWSAAVDRHGRIYAAALGNTFGVIRTFRAEQFLRKPGATEPHVVAAQIAGGMVSWVPGYSSSLPASTTTVLSDRPEAIPRKLQILLQDEEGSAIALADFKEEWGALITKMESLSGGSERLTLAVPIDNAPAYPYLLQRVTVENVTSAFRSSGDARPGQPAVLEIIAGTRDRLRIVRNLRTYGVVSLFGYGLGILDLQALESNDAPGKPAGWKPLQEKIAFTRASIELDDSLPSTWSVSEIPDLTFSPDAAILPGEGGPNVLALDSRRGILDVGVRPQPSIDGTVTLGARRQSSGLIFRATLGAQVHDHPRLAHLRAKFKALAGRDPSARFNTIAPYRWTLNAAHNTPVALKSKYGRRGSPAYTGVTRDYAFVAANEYGLLVVEAGGDEPLALAPHEPLANRHLVDVIWIPAGAAGVRVIHDLDIVVVIDGLGHLNLVDISRIDERFGVDGAPIAGGDLFATASESLSGKGAYGVGKPDPRILWRSDAPVGSGTLAPLFDANSGIAFAGRLLGRRLEVISASTARLRVLVDLGVAAQGPSSGLLGAPKEKE